jgi:hypothetical protein
VVERSKRAEDKLRYAGMYLLKKMDLKPEDGGLVLPAVLPHELEPLDEVVQELALAGFVELNRRKERWEITKAGFAYIGALIEEAEALIDEFDDQEPAEMLAELKRRRLDPFRARFLWGWYQDELDDLVLFQQRRGVEPVERSWADYLVSDAFYDNLALETIESEPPQP